MKRVTYWPQAWLGILFLLKIVTVWLMTLHCRVRYELVIPGGLGRSDKLAGLDCSCSNHDRLHCVSYKGISLLLMVIDIENSWTILYDTIYAFQVRTFSYVFYIYILVHAHYDMLIRRSISFRRIFRTTSNVASNQPRFCLVNKTQSLSSAHLLRSWLPLSLMLAYRIIKVMDSSCLLVPQLVIFYGSLSQLI